MAIEKELLEEYCEAMAEGGMEGFRPMGFAEWKEHRAALDELGKEIERRKE